MERLGKAWNDDLGGTIGTDFDILYAVSRRDCPTMPMPGCHQTIEAGSALLTIKDGPGGKDKASFRWRDGDEVNAGELGDPTTTSSYAFCLYTESGGSLIAATEEDITAAAECAGAPCWAPYEEGYRYIDKKYLNSSMQMLTLVPGAAGESVVDARLIGSALGPPPLPLDLSLPSQVQLINPETNACWQATFSSAVRNDAIRFKAVSD